MVLTKVWRPVRRCADASAEAWRDGCGGRQDRGRGGRHWTASTVAACAASVPAWTSRASGGCGVTAVTELPNIRALRADTAALAAALGRSSSRIVDKMGVIMVSKDTVSVGSEPEPLPVGEGCRRSAGREPDRTYRRFTPADQNGIMVCTDDRTCAVRAASQPALPALTALTALTLAAVETLATAE
jgi:hypothetical protein